MYNSNKTSETISCIYGYLIYDKGYTEEVGLWKLVIKKQNHKIVSLFYTNQSHID